MDPGETLARLAEARPLLVACDYDGTLSPIVDDPARARPQPGAIEVIGRLSSLPDTVVALVSGRARQDLVTLSGPPGRVLLVGGHGGERDSTELGPDLAALLTRLVAELEELVAAFEGARLEAKPTGIAVHYRHVDRGRIDELLDAVANGPGSIEGLTVRHGKEVVELSVLETDKGAALEDLREETGAEVILYLGDDVTDEDAFGRLGEGDVGVKVGEGDTRARYRLADAGAVVDFLERLVRARRRAAD